MGKQRKADADFKKVKAALKKRKNGAQPEEPKAEWDITEWDREWLKSLRIKA
jgi:hypothetical protein